MRFLQTSRSWRWTIGIVLAAAACSDAAAQTSYRVEVRKQIRYDQISSGDVVPRSTNAYQFRANIAGTGIAGMTPAPRVDGPFNVGALGAQHNNGVLVYDAYNQSWRWGQGGTDFATSSAAELDALFPNGTYRFTLPGTSVPPLSLTGNAYPVAPRLTLTGGDWVGGAYHLDPARPLTITSSVFAEWGTLPDHLICLLIRGPGFLPSDLEIVTLSQCQFGSQWTQQPAASSAAFTVPANGFTTGQEYTVSVAFVTIASGTVGRSARFGSVTTARIKTVPPVFAMTVTSAITPTTATASAQIQFRPQDVGTQGSVFVFALAPATRVQDSAASDVLKVGVAQGGSKADAPVACVLAQLNSAGQMTAVSSANLAAYLTGVLSAQGASVSILNGVPTNNVAGATFFVGYGPNSTTMINGGVNRAAVTVPGSLTCTPSKPQTGWWWNPLEDGRGFSLEVRGNNMFFASFLYDVSGRSTWYVSTGPASLEGSYYTGDLLSAAGGQTLGGPYSRFPTLSSLGTMTVTFNNESTGTLVWPGGTVPIQRFNIIPNGLNLPAVAGQPENGWWWNEQEAGRGFFMEWQNGTLDIAGYMYDDDGNSVWYLTVGAIGGTAAARSFSGNWWSYGDGMPLAGPWRQHRQTSNSVAPVTITFTGADTALMTLPNGRTTNLRRHRF